MTKRINFGARELLALCATAQQFVDDLESALEQFPLIAADLGDKAEVA